MATKKYDITNTKVSASAAKPKAAVAAKPAAAAKPVKPVKRTGGGSVMLTGGTARTAKVSSTISGGSSQGKGRDKSKYAKK